MSDNKVPTEKKVKDDLNNKIIYFGRKPQEDVYLTANPTISFFKLTYRRCTEFSDKSTNQNKTNINDK